MKRVMLLGAGTQALAILPALRREFDEIIFYVKSRNNYSDVSRYSDRVVYQKSDDPNEILNDLLHNKEMLGIDFFIPMGDVSAAFISKYQVNFAGCTVLSPKFSSFQRGYDKNRLMALCQEKGYPHPHTLDLSQVDINNIKVKEFKYPALLKPNCTTGGRGMVEVKDYDELCRVYDNLHRIYGDYHLQRLVKPGGRQVKAQLYIGRDGKLVASSVLEKCRWYPISGGSNCCAISVEDDILIQTCYNVLRDLQWIGFADFDTIEDPDTGELLIMEINPRLPACIKAAVAAGVDWGRIIVKDSIGLPVPATSYKSGIILRHLGLDFMWFLKSENRWKAKPSWFKFIGRDIYYQDMSDWTDPFPFICGTLHNIGRLFSPSFRKQKNF